MLMTTHDSIDCLVVGAGALAVGLYGQWHPRTLLGVCRRDKDFPFPVVYGDTASNDFWFQESLPGEVQSILITATPGLRKGGPGNGLELLCDKIRQRYPAARVVYTASTAVYGDAAVCDEQHTPSSTGRSPALQAIEQAVLRWDNAVVLRVGAIVGPSRLPRRLNEITEGGELTIAGDPQRPFPFIHEQDLLQVLIRCLEDHAIRGIRNCVAPHDLTYADYYQGYLTESDLRIIGDERPMPSRRVIAKPLWQLFSGHKWLLPWDNP